MAEQDAKLTSYRRRLRERGEAVSEDEDGFHAAAGLEPDRLLSSC